MSDKANEELQAAAELELASRLKAIFDSPCSQKKVIRCIATKFKTKYSTNDVLYVFGPDSAIVAAAMEDLSSYSGDKFGFVDGVPFLRANVGSADRRILEERGYLLSITYYEEPPPPSPPSPAATPSAGDQL